MVHKAKKLYRKVNSDSEKTLENEFEKKKASETIELNTASIDEILEINQDEMIDDLELSLEYELDLNLVAKQISKSNPADAQSLIEKYQKELEERQIQSESEKQNAKWLLQQRLRKRLRKAGCEDPNDLEDQLVASEKAILDSKLASQKEKDEMINSNNQQYNADYKVMVKTELEGASIDTQVGFQIDTQI